MRKSDALATLLTTFLLLSCSKLTNISMEAPRHVTFCIGNGMFATGLKKSEAAPKPGAIFTLPDVAYKMQELVLDKLALDSLIPRGVRVDRSCFMYNHNERLLTQLVQVLRQKAEDGEIADAWRRYLSTNGSLASAMELEKIAARLDAEGEEKDYDLGRHLNDYRKYLGRGDVITLAHSQGNFYANRAYTALFGRRGSVPRKNGGRLRIVSVATPASSVADGRGEYITFYEDIVILGVSRAADPLLEKLDKALGHTSVRKTLPPNAFQGTGRLCIASPAKTLPHTACETPLIPAVADNVLGVGVTSDALGLAVCAAAGRASFKNIKCPDGLSWTSHDLVDDYLATPSSRERIQRMIQRAAGVLP